eukprot:m51a1_g37 hypothetical protein (322) ;mRNA; f:140139-141897
MAEAALRKKYEDLLKFGQSHPDLYHQNLNKLRRLILLEGLPPQSQAEKDNVEFKCSLRGRVWKILLGVKSVSAQRYTRLVSRGPSLQSDKIDRDKDRTFQHDTSFHSVVSQQKLCRMLNAYVHRSFDLSAEGTSGYVQGINAIAGAMLYVLPEVDASEVLHCVVHEHLPQYFALNLPGVHKALAITAAALRLFDPTLYEHLTAFGFHPQLITHLVLSLGTSTPPLEEVLHIWDFVFAPCALLRTMPRLEAAKIVSVATAMVRQLPDDVWALAVAHGYDPLVDVRGLEPERIAGTAVDLAPANMNAAREVARGKPRRVGGTL